MKYEYLNGGEKDFERAPEWCTIIYNYGNSDAIRFCNGWKEGCKFSGTKEFLTRQYDVSASDLIRYKIIAERRPITEPELKPIYGDGIHDDTEALQQRIDMGIDIKPILNNGVFLTLKPLQFKPITEPVWSGEDLPPVGCVCEYRGNDTSWGEVKIIGHDEGKVVFKPSGEDYYGITPSHKAEFIPIRAPEDVARDEAVAAMREVLGHAAGLIEVSNIYRAIAAGKIPGISLSGK